jgi:DNA-binding response OmpR family regulator
MRVLYVTTYERTGGWLAEALAADSASEVVLEEAIGFAAGLSRLRDDHYDAVLVGHQPGQLDALALAEAMHTAGCDEPLIVLGSQDESEMTALCLEANADAYVSVQSTTTRTLLWVVARAIERHYLLRENRRLAQADQHRLEIEQGDAGQLLSEQRGLIRELDALAATAQGYARNATGEAREEGVSRTPLPAQLETHYRELLRTYVMMGSGNLSVEMLALAQILAAAGVSPAQTLELHLNALENLLRGLGNRSARHVMNRADLLALEIGAHLCEAYRQTSAAASQLHAA